MNACFLYFVSNKIQITKYAPKYITNFSRSRIEGCHFIQY